MGTSLVMQEAVGGEEEEVAESCKSAQGGMQNGLGREGAVALEETETAHWMGRGSEEDVAGGRWKREAAQKSEWRQK